MDLPSNEVANGDKMDDLDLQHEGDHNDDIVEDTGFSGSRGHRIGTFAQIEKRVRRNKKMGDYIVKSPSDETANGDESENKQLEHEGDHQDDIVEDTGFSGSRGHVIRARTYAQTGRRVHHHKKIGEYVVTQPSDEIANGDESENKQVEHEGDH